MGLCRADGPGAFLFLFFSPLALVPPSPQPSDSGSLGKFHWGPALLLQKGILLLGPAAHSGPPEPLHHLGLLPFTLP